MLGLQTSHINYVSKISLPLFIKLSIVIAADKRAEENKRVNVTRKKLNLA